MWDELRVERAVSNDDLASAVARACGIDRERITVTDDGATAIGGLVVERRPALGDFALRLAFYGAPPADRIAFHSALAHELACKVLVDDGDVDPYTALLVTPDGSAVRVNLDVGQRDRDALVIAGLWHRLETDGAPDLTARPTELPVRKLNRRTRGERLSFTVNEYTVVPVPALSELDARPRAPAPARAPALQAAEHELAHQLRQLVGRTATSEDLRIVRATSATLRRAFPDSRSAGMFIDELLRAADFVLEAPWDPDALVGD
ncbi:MAG: hypothetical protein M3680_14990 [Myxococcota bacterium]|nr:hypothetical protein [Myxococcota bacterium]